VAGDLEIPSSFTPISQLHQSPPSPVPGEEVPVTSLTYSNVETRMDRPKSVVVVIRGVAQTVDVSFFLWASSGIYRDGVRYLRAFCYF